MIATELTGVVAEHIAAVNALDTNAIVATFAEDAYVNDARREFAGIDAIRRWVAKEMVGDKVSIDVREVLGHHGDTIVRGAYDGGRSRTGGGDGYVLECKPTEANGQELPRPGSVSVCPISRISPIGLMGLMGQTRTVSCNSR